MRIQVNGDIEIESINGIIESVIMDTLNKLGQPAEGVKLNQVVFETAFIVDGFSEPVRMTVEHNGNYEPFIVIVDTDENGNITRTEDNEEQPFYDEVYHKLAKGEDIVLPTEKIASEYRDDELAFIDEVIGGEIRGVRYSIKSEDTKQLLRYFNNEILVAEMVITEKEPHVCNCQTPCIECNCM